MSNIKFIVDSTSDIPDDILKQYNIDMLCVPVALDGEGYYERRDFSIIEFYSMIEKTHEIPTTSQIPVAEFLAAYEKALSDGYKSIVTVTINAKGSGIFSNAVMARNQFYEAHPDKTDAFKIDVVDSRSYSIGIGYPVMEAVKLAETDASHAEVVAYLTDYFEHLEIYLAVYSLEYAKKSGRLNAVAAFVGDVLGLRPIMALIDGENKTYAKIRGEKQVLSRLIDIYKERRESPDAPVQIVRGAVDQYPAELKPMMDAETGRDVPVYHAGAAIVINAGPKIVALAFRGKKRA